MVADDDWPPAIVVHSLDQALTAAAAAQSLGRRLVLHSARGAGGFAGVGWFAALGKAVTEIYPDLPVRWVLDCADEAGTALGAVRRGLGHLRFSGNAAIAAKLSAIAADAGAALDSDPRPVLDLIDSADPDSACRNWLGGV